MSPENFCYWLQGFFELTDPKELTDLQIKMIRQHLQLVFRKETYSIDELQEMNLRQKLGYSPHITCSIDKNYDIIGFKIYEDKNE